MESLPAHPASPLGPGHLFERVKSLLGFKAKGRDIIKGEEGYRLREEAAPYKALFDAEKGDIGPENTYFWDINNE